MSRLPKAPGAPIEDKSQLVEYMASGCAPRADWRIGTEHEKFMFDAATLRPLAYDGAPGIAGLLNGLTRFGWTPVKERGNTIALAQDQASITLEPGGQFELSGAPLATLHDTANELRTHMDQVKTVADEIGAGALGLGFIPQWRRDDMAWMPKGRYAVMRAYMPTKGDLGLDMMTRTSTVQVNLDFESESDMVRKFRISLALQPIATALFANSPFREGQDSGFLSLRSQVWSDTDPDRCGMLPFVFEEGFGFERYVDYLLDVPMYFVYRDGQYIDVAGRSFRDFMAGRLAELEGQLPRESDWVDHMTTAFPEVRLKKYLEMRGADSGPLDMLAALPALWVGLLYDPAAEAAAANLIADWTVSEMAALRDEVPRSGLKTPFRGGTVGDIASQVVTIARQGLVARARRDGSGADESVYLAPLEAIAASGVTRADELLAAFNGPWQSSVLPAYEACRY